jgi:hypothetical protein
MTFSRTFCESRVFVGLRIDDPMRYIAFGNIDSFYSKSHYYRIYEWYCTAYPMGSVEKIALISVTDSLDLIYADQCAYHVVNVAPVICLASVNKKTPVKSVCARDDSGDVISYSAVFCTPRTIWARR